jgi:hypothetical protein
MMLLKVALKNEPIDQCDKKSCAENCGGSAEVTKKTPTQLQQPSRDVKRDTKGKEMKKPAEADAMTALEPPPGYDH